MRAIDLITAFILLILFIGLTINHNNNIKNEKITKMKKMAKHRVDTK